MSAEAAKKIGPEELPSEEWNPPTKTGPEGVDWQALNADFARDEAAEDDEFARLLAAKAGLDTTSKTSPKPKPKPETTSRPKTPATSKTTAKTTPKTEPETAGNVGKECWQGFYYDGRKYFMDHGSDYIPMDCTSVSRYLRRAGQDVDRSILKIQTENYVNHAGPLAGKPRGLHRIDSKKWLVTSSPIIPEPCAGSWATLGAVLEGLVGRDEHGEGGTQLAILNGWIRAAYRSLRSGSYRPGQALALCGPKSCGKTLLVQILQKILGGRSQAAHRYLTSDTGFNADCVGAELLLVDDQSGDSRHPARMRLAAGVKSSLFAHQVRIEAKGKDAFSCRPWWRVVFALNDQPENLLVLPQITEDISDKLTLLRCQRFALPMPAGTDEERAAFWAQLAREIPAYLHWLEDGFSLPAELAVDQRCAVVAYRHPVLSEEMSSISPEAQLLELIGQAEEQGHLELPATLSALALRSHLTDRNFDGWRIAEQLADWKGAYGSYLTRLSQSHPRLVKQAGKSGVMRYRLESHSFPTSSTEEPEEEPELF
jgi:energy-coupling factor transporter ATP-binding protein EcfA2